jgi:hypothetical protein
VIKTLEAQILVCCKCPVSRGIVVQEQDRGYKPPKLVGNKAILKQTCELQIKPLRTRFFEKENQRQRIPYLKQAVSLFNSHSNEQMRIEYGSS